MGESVGVNPPAPPQGLRPYDPLKTKNKNLSKKGKQEARCALPLVGAEQDASERGCTELARTGTRCVETDAMFWGGSVARFCGDHRGDTGRQPDRHVQNGPFKRRIDVTLKSQAGSAGSTMQVLTC